jgi:hypothetical protein
MTLLSTAAINPALIDLLPARMHAEAACKFWLTNPLLVEAHAALVAQRTTELPSLAPLKQRQLATKLAAQRDYLKAQHPVHGETLSQPDLLAVLTAHNALMDETEYRQARYLAFSCHPAERLWMAEHFRNVLQARLAVLHEQDEQDQHAADDYAA